MRGYSAWDVMEMIQRQNKMNLRLGIKTISFNEEGVCYYMQLINRHPELFNNRHVAKNVTAKDVLEEYETFNYERVLDMADYAAEEREDNEDDCYD